MSRIWIIMIVPFTLTFCNSPQEEQKYIPDEAKLSPQPDAGIDLEWPEIQFKNYKVVHGIKYQFKVVSALDFLARNHERVAEEDKKDLAEESVIIFELQDTNAFKNIFEHERLVMDRDQTIQYLCGGVMNDLTVEQDGKRLSCNGVQYEGVMGANNNKIRVLTFFKGVDLNQDFHIQYNDPLFEAGLVRVTKKTKQVAL